MTDFKLTFDDGDEAILSHHGIKGMKWGKWNPETMLKYGVSGGVKGAMSSVARNSVKTAGVGGGGGLIEKEGNEDNETTEETPIKNLSDMIAEKKEQALAEKAAADAAAAEQERQASRQQYDAEVNEIANQVIRGDWGNGEERYSRITESGRSYEDVQTKVNDIIYGTNDYDEGRNTSLREDPDNRSRRK